MKSLATTKNTCSKEQSELLQNLKQFGAGINVPPSNLALPAMHQTRINGVRVICNADAAPSDHNRDTPLIVTPSPILGVPGRAGQFASIIVLEKGEKLASASRLCIHVLWEKNDIVFADGVIGFACMAHLIPFPKPVPLLANALRRSRREWSELLSPRPNEKPSLALKNYYEGDKEFDLKGSELGACDVLMALLKWNSLNTSGADWYKRLCEISNPTKLKTAEDVAKAVNRFEKFCKELGLKKGHNCASAMSQKHFERWLKSISKLDYPGFK
jgi:hypothetical protein